MNRLPRILSKFTVYDMLCISMGFLSVQNWSKFRCLGQKFNIAVNKTCTLRTLNLRTWERFINISAVLYVARIF